MPDSPAVRAVLDGGGPAEFVEVDTGTVRYLVLAMPVTVGEQSGWYLAAASMMPLEAARDALVMRWAGFSIAVLGACILVCAVVAFGYVYGPVRIRRRDDDSGPLKVVVAEGFLSRLAFGLLSFSLPLYAWSMGMSLGGIGMLLATNTAVAVVLKPLMGRAIDRIGVRQAFVIAVALRTLVVLALVFASTPAHLFAARGLHGVSIALRDPSASTVLAALGGKKAVAQRFAWYQTAKTVAGSSGQVGAGVLITALAGNYAAVFTVATVLSAIPLLLVITGLRGPSVTGLVVPRPEKRAPLPAALKASLAPYALLGALMTGTAYLMSNLLPVLAVEHMGLPAAAASTMYAFTAVVALSGPVWGWVADRISLKLVLGVRAVGNIVSSLVWLVFPGYPGLIAGKVTDDVGKAAFRPAWGAVMARVSALDPPRRAQTLALMSSAEDLGELGAPVLAGVIWSTFGLPTLLITRTVAGLLAETYAWWLGSRGLLTDPDTHPEPIPAGTAGTTNPTSR
ncbi:MAG: MFS transporter [Propionibacterium sp.]|nr:MFS transporter [Propionibacterium sp.]